MGSSDSLRDQSVLLLDCQTTGMQPTSGHLLEIAWVVVKGSDTEMPPVTSFLLKQPEDSPIPRRISELTGITKEDLKNAVEPTDVLQKLKVAAQSLGPHPLAIIHYATFETSFLKHLFASLGETALPFEILCSYKMAQRLFPQLPSRNIRGVAGFFGHRTGDFKRAACHVQATFEIWKGLSQELLNRDLNQLEDVKKWLQNAPKVKRTKYEYHIDAERRLTLSKKPGVYRMLDKTGQVLYVGKATSLRDRVNSYFRGQKGRDPRKLEMLAQAWDLQVTECETPLEAALLENDEIKRLNPPYNISLKVGRRRLLFYSRDFETVWTSQNSQHPLGPLPAMNSLEQLRLLFLAWGQQIPSNLFYEEIDPVTLQAGLDLFLLEVDRQAPSFQSLRGLLALGMNLYRQQKKHESEEDPEVEATEELMEDEAAAQSEEDLPRTPEEVAAKFGRLFVRAGAELQRSKKLTRLLNARVQWKIADQTLRTLDFRQGRLQVNSSPSTDLKNPWQGLQIADYDRMSILLSGLARTEHHLQPLPPKN